MKIDLNTKDNETQKTALAILYLKEKIRLQGRITNARDEEHLVNLERYYEELINEN